MVNMGMGMGMGMGMMIGMGMGINPLLDSLPPHGIMGHGRTRAEGHTGPSP